MATLSGILTTHAGNWTLVPGRSRVSFQNKTLWGLSTVTGRFTEFTGEGTAALERAHERIVGVFSSALEGWTDEEISSLTDALGRLRDDYDRAAADNTISTTQKEAA